jgi:hypothetical protein
VAGSPLCVILGLGGGLGHRHPVAHFTLSANPGERRKSSERRNQSETEDSPEEMGPGGRGQGQRQSGEGRGEARETGQRPCTVCSLGRLLPALPQSWAEMGRSCTPPCLRERERVPAQMSSAEAWAPESSRTKQENWCPWKSRFLDCHSGGCEHIAEVGLGHRTTSSVLGRTEAQAGKKRMTPQQSWACQDPASLEASSVFCQLRR